MEWCAARPIPYSFEFTTTYTLLGIFIYSSFTIQQTHIMSYLILDNIFTTIEKEIVGLLEGIFWPLTIKCAMKRNWLQTIKTHIGYVDAGKTLAPKR